MAVGHVSHRADALKADLMALAAAHLPVDAEEARHRASLTELVQRQPSAAGLFDRHLGPIHVTATAIVLNPRADCVLTVWHAGLRRWLQPGGHIEWALDRSIEAAASRELAEETGLVTGEARLVSPAIFDIDVHDMPGPACTTHIDLRFLYAVERAMEPDRADVRWRRLDEIEATEPSALSRFARKVLRL